LLVCILSSLLVIDDPSSPLTADAGLQSALGPIRDVVRVFHVRAVTKGWFAAPNRRDAWAGSANEKKPLPRHRACAIAAASRSGGASSITEKPRQ